MEERLAQVEQDLEDIALTVERFEEAILKLIARVDSLTSAHVSANPTAGGQYRGALIEFFDQHPDEWFTPGALNHALGFGKGHNVSLGQACRGLVKSGVLISSINPKTERNWYKKA